MSSEWQAGAVVQHGEVWRTVGDTDGQTFSFMYSEDAGNWDYCEHATMLLPAPAVVTTWQMAWELLLPLTVRHDGNGAEDDPDYRVIDCDGHGVIRVFRPDLQTHGSHKIYLLAELCTDDATALRTAANRLEVLQQWLSAVAATILAQSSGSDGKGEGTVTG